MKLIKKKVFKFFAFILAGLTLATTATPFIVSCSKSAPNEEDNNVVKQDYWWPKDVLINNFSVGECIGNYFTQKFRQYAPNNSIKFNDLKSWFFPPSTWDERIGSLWFKDFNKLPVYANTQDYSGSRPDTDAILKNNPNKISYVKVFYGDLLANYKDEINWYYKKTDQKLKAFKDDLEPTIPVYEVYANINLPWTISLVLYHEDLYKIDPIKYPASTIEIRKRDFVSKHNVKLKFKIAIAQDADNLGEIYPGQDYFYIDNSSLKDEIDEFESGNPNYQEPPNDGNYDW